MSSAPTKARHGKRPSITLRSAPTPFLQLPVTNSSSTHTIALRMAGFGRSRKWLLYITLFALLAVFGIYSGYTPQSVKIPAGFYSARENVRGLRESHLVVLTNSVPKVPEIYGLFDLVLPTVTKHEQLLPSKHSSLLVDGPQTGASPNLERGIYDLGADPVDWKLRREEIDHDYPIIVFGKVRSTLSQN